MKIKFLLLLIVALAIAACGTTDISTEPIVQEDEQLSVGVTFYPYYDLTKEITNGFADVFSVVPATSEPHSFDPSPKDFAKLESVDIYVATGVEFENFEDQLIAAVSDNALIIQASEGIELLTAEEHKHDTDDEHAEDEHHEEDEHAEDEHHEEDEHADEEHVDDEHDHHHGGTDPHVWLAPNNAITIANNIASKIKEAYPEYAEQIDANLNKLVSDLTQLNADYEESLNMCNQDTILVAHNAYQYLANDYGFEAIAISGLSPESEPTAKQLAELIEEAKEHNISYVFFEELVQPRVSQTIADEVGATTMQLNPVAGSISGQSYIEIMYENLDKLVIGLECS